MTREGIAAARELIVRLLAATGDLAPTVILDVCRDKQVGHGDCQAALWGAAHDGEIAFTPDWRVRLAQGEAP